MREIVKCKNCGIAWVRVTVFGSNLELTEDLMYNCPKCGSNWYEIYQEPVPQRISRVKIIGKIFCKLGFHLWLYNSPEVKPKTVRQCRRCYRNERFTHNWELW